MKKNNTLLAYIFIGFLVTPAFATVFNPLPTDITEPQGIYNSVAPNLLRVDAKTVIGQGPCVIGDYSGCTLDDVHNDTDGSDDFKPEVKIHFTADDFPDDGKTSNATLRLRGASSRFAELKSYRIKLDSKKDLWREQRKLQLNKHLGDITRIKNKLSFDLMSSIPHLTSLRTQFVHFYIDNQDYGLYTHVENVGKEYLKRRGFDKNSNLYKAENFEFRLRPELQIDGNGQPLDIKAFESILEIKRGKDSKKLLEMLRAVDNSNNNFQTDVMDKYFNVNNFLTWASVNILMGNSDIKSSNFYIFNPKGKDTFYFLPWDYDLSWGDDYEENTINSKSVPPKSYRGPHYLWATEFGERFLSQPGSLDLLKSAVLEIKNKYLTANKVKTLIDSYYDVVFPVVSQNPDFDFMNFNRPTDALILQAYFDLYNALPSVVERNYQTFLKELESPTPFWLNDPVLSGKNIVFDWDESVDLQGDAVTYDLEISNSPSFRRANIKFIVKDLKTNHFTTRWTLPKGTYYYRVTARDDKNAQENWQQSFNEFYDEGLDRRIFGVKKFTIDIDGDNNVSAIIIDGQADDWQGKLTFTDANDISTPNVVDWRKGGFTQDNENLYLAYINDDAIDINNLWVWQVFINVDNNDNNGYDGGYEFVLEGDQLWKYVGDGQSWDWQYVTNVEYNINGKFAEFAIPKFLVNNSNTFKFLFFGPNRHLQQGLATDYMQGE